MRIPMLTERIERRNTPFVYEVNDSIQPQGCSIFKKIACAGALVACGAVCIGSAGTACAACFAGLGMGSCIECL